MELLPRRDSAAEAQQVGLGGKKRTSASLAFSTAVTVSEEKIGWRGAEPWRSSPHSSTSCSSSALTGGSEPDGGPTRTSSPRT